MFLVAVFYFSSALDARRFLLQRTFTVTYSGRTRVGGAVKSYRRHGQISQKESMRKTRGEQKIVQETVYVDGVSHALCFVDVAIIFRTIRTTGTVWRTNLGNNTTMRAPGHAHRYLLHGVHVGTCC